MGQRNIALAPGEFYHVYNRGTDKRDIFLDDADYRRFTELLFLCNSESAINVRDIRNTEKSIFTFDRGDTKVAVGAYCLMPNHFHLLITPVVDNGIFTFMNKVCTGYSMYFNKRYKRTGALFQGRYKAQHAHSDEYLKYLFSYIHLNPVKLIQSDWKESGINNSVTAYQYASSYSYSSLPDYLGMDRVEEKILSLKSFPVYFKDAASHRDELISWLSFTK